MSEKTLISWTDSTWNPWEGCTKISPGCANCYAATRNHRFGGDNWGKGKPRRRTSPGNWRKPHVWNRAAQGKPKSVFPSLCDVYDSEVPIDLFVAFLRVIFATPNLRWLLLTKRTDLHFIRLWEAMNLLIRNYDEHSLFGQWLTKWREGVPPQNVWVGASVENQAMADRRIPELLEIPAVKRFLSVEPMLERIDLQYAALTGAESLQSRGGIDWVFFGGESGPGARPCYLQWIRDGVRQCQLAGVKVFVKQLGAFPVMGRDDAHIVRDKKGGDMSEWPEDLRVREMPE